MSTIEFDIKNDKLMSLTDIINTLKRCNVIISRNTFYRWIRSGYFPQYSFRIGGQKRWTERSFKDWLIKCIADAKG
jgi:predicted DNA-binding transcriptional regulator AlpA